MEGEDINPVVLDNMKKNGAFLKLYSLFLAKISQEGQNTNILVLQPYKKVRREDPYKIAADIVMKYLNSHKFTNTITSVKAEFKNSDIYTNPESNLEDQLKLPKSPAPIKAMLKIWKKDISTPFYNNRDKLSDIIRDRYQRLSVTDNSSKNQNKKKETSPTKPQASKNSSSPKQVDTEKTPKQVKKLPPPPKEIEPSYSYESQDTESIEPWQPPMGMQRPQMQGKQLQLPKPKQSFQFKPIQVKDSSEY